MKSTRRKSDMKSTRRKSDMKSTRRKSEKYEKVHEGRVI